MANLTENEWIEKYKPLANPVSADHGFDYGEGSTLVETYGPDVAYLETIPENRIWTVMDDDDGNPCITSGKHFVNRIGYIVTAEAFDETEDHFVDLEN